MTRLLRELRPRPLVLLAVVAAGEYLVPWRLEGRALALLAGGLLTARFLADSARHLRAVARVPAIIRARFVEFGLTAIALVLLASKAFLWVQVVMEPAAGGGLAPAYRQYAGAFLVAAALRLVAGGLTARRALHRLDLRPAQTVALGFASAILVGTVLLSLPVSVARVEDLSLLDTLFTAASAVTVTGLTVDDPSGTLTPFGRVVLLVLIQLGGVGTMAASGSLVVLAGRRLRLQRAAALQETMDLETVGQVRTLLRTIVMLTAAAETLGALVLYLAWRGRPEIEAPAFHAVFHAVSAFCNAGFSTFSTGLLEFRDDVATTATMATLIVVGGLGFPVVANLVHALPALRGHPHRPLLSLHTRLTLATTGVLLAAGALGVLVLEVGRTFAELGWPSRLAAATFLSVTARTAGFNTVDTATLAPATLWLVMLLMFVGGCPGSTAGGIKTTTAATVVAALWAAMRGRPQVEAFRRTVPQEQVAKALALVGVSLATVSVVAVLLLAVQPGDPLGLLFETVSAFGTVGLSTGVTPHLHATGKVLIIAAMFVGRTGPLTLGFALAATRERRRVVYPPEKVMIG